MSEPLEHTLLEVVIFLFVCLCCVCIHACSSTAVPHPRTLGSQLFPSTLHSAALELRSSGLAAVPFPSQRLLARPNVFLKDASYTSKVLYFIFVSPVYLELMLCAEGRGGLQISCSLMTVAH